ncbi:MEIOTIC F-BOX protein MOF-like [Lolium perenne]|uniref:MEIOTIC F-BOX protein MOF-like n=1 Tax=Lolium perenne TaxID=4522 RepID=UPI0021F582C9|nr:MEIOTIC F-BOX protein MOF-like [Lolium perenne]
MASGRGDRIGALPDDLLHHVLSFLPAHLAVRTCVLARRWLHLWKSAPALRVTGIKGCNNAVRFVNFVDNLLLLRDPRARLESFELDLDERDFDFEALLPAYERRVNLWFRLAFTCGTLENLALRTTNGIYIYPDDYETLWFANVPLISQHLTRLELKRVYVLSSTLDFSGCPALIHLRMEDCDIEGNISSPFLKHLSIVASFFQTDPVRARISLPGLVSLELTGVLRRTPVLESMPLLVSAIVRLELDCHDNCSKNDYGDCGNRRCWNCHDPRTGADDWRGKSVLLKGLSEAAELELSVDSQVFIVNRDLKLCPTFSKLKTLLLSEWCPDIASDLNILSCFLKHSPILEKLTLQISKVPKRPAEIQRSYTPPEQPFALCHLKSVDIRFDEVDGKVLNILRAHGVPLEKVNIQRNKLLDLNVS